MLPLFWTRDNETAARRVLKYNGTHMSDSSTTNTGNVRTMPMIDSIAAFTALSLTLGFARIDIRDGSKALGFLTSTLFEPQTAPQRLLRNSRIGLISSAESSLRASAPLAFLYLAHRDYKRATEDYGIPRDAHVGLAAWRWKAWALCGVIGLAVGPLGPYSSFLMRPLERHLQRQHQAYSSRSDGSTKHVIARWGKLMLGRGAVLLASFPVCIKAFSLM